MQHAFGDVAMTRDGRQGKMCAKLSPAGNETELAGFLEWAPCVWGLHRSQIPPRLCKNPILFGPSDISHSECQNGGGRSTISFFLSGVTSQSF